MRILLSSADLIDLVTKHTFSTLVPDAKSADVEIGVLNGAIVAAIAVGEDNFALKTIADLTGPLVSGSTPVAETEKADLPDAQSEESEDTDTDTDTDSDDTSSDETKPKRRKRRTKAEIEADKAAEEAAAQAEVEAEAEAQEETSDTEEVDPFADAETSGEEANAADDAAPFDIDEGATVRAEADVIPETKSDDVDPFADAGVASSEGDELFAQADVPVTKVVENSEAGFAKPTETEDDPFANFD